MNWTLVIHGGAGVIRRAEMKPEKEQAIRAALGRALDAGAAVLSAEGSAVDAVEAAVRVLENDPNFNAGRGAALTSDGTVELDAAIMDGRGRDAGAVTGVHRARNPVSLARAVMENSPHVFLGGEGADAFGEANGLEQAGLDWFVTDERRANLAEMRASGKSAFDVEMKYGTVGAVARDAHGHVAAATSTGGVTGQAPGRIGDSPVIGAGTWADDRSCAVSATGSGEFFLRAGVGHEIGAMVRLSGATLQQAADAAIADVGGLGGSGGVIAAGRDGGVWAFNSDGMYRGRADASGERTIAIYGDE